MLFDKFIEDTVSWWSKYFRFVATMQSEGKLDSNGGKILFPSMLIFSNCSGYYVAEFMGASEEFKKLQIKRHNEQSIYRYLSQFDDKEPDPVFHLDGACQGFRHLCLAQESDFETVKIRFPQIELYGSKLNRTGGRGSVFSFGKNFVSCALENCVLINRKDDVFRCKNILSAYIVKGVITRAELNKLYNNTTKDNQVKGVHTVTTGEENRLIVSAQLQSMYLFPGLRETTLGEFLKNHPDIIKHAFKTTHFEYEPYLKWIEHDGTCQDDAINPDLLIKRNDGFYDIYDLKTALLDKSSLTKGERKRRRFIDYVEEGIAQLANYREYFEYSANAEYAESKYNIKIENPKLVLVVGTWENANVDEVNQACRRYKGVEVIDYDTFCHLFIGAS